MKKRLMLWFAVLSLNHWEGISLIASPTFDTIHFSQTGSISTLTTSLTVDGPAQRFTTDSSQNLRITAIGVSVVGLSNPYNFPFGAGQLHANIYYDYNGQPLGGTNFAFTRSQTLGTLNQDPQTLHVGENWLYGSVSLASNTSYWVVFDNNPNGYDGNYWTTVSFGLSSQGTGDWLHPADHIAGLYQIDVPPFTWTYYSGSMVQMEITAVLEPPNPPVITVQPQAVTANAHDSVSFSVSATGSPPLRYRWLLNGTNIPGAISSVLMVTNVTQSTLGNYSVVITNAFGTNVSSNALLSMPPFLAGPFSGAVTFWGKPATLSAQVWGSDPLVYQWLKDGVALSGATNSTLNFSAVQLSDAGLYSVIVSNSLGSVTNTPAQVIVNPANIDIGLRSSVTIDGAVGYTYGIDYSTNLTDTNAWVRITNLTLSEPVQIWVDTSVDVRTAKSRYYRVVAQ